MTYEDSPNIPPSPRRKRSLTDEGDFQYDSEDAHNNKKQAVDSTLSETPSLNHDNEATDDHAHEEIMNPADEFEPIEETYQSPTSQNVHPIHESNDEEVNKGDPTSTTPRPDEYNLIEPLSPVRSQRSSSRSLSPHPRRHSPSPTRSDAHQNLTTEKLPDPSSIGRSTSDAVSSTISSRGSTNSSTHIPMRALVSTKDAGIIIGKQGKHVQQIRDESGARVTISEQVEGVSERILNVAGPIDVVAKAFNLIARKLIKEHQNRLMNSPDPPREIPSPSQQPTSMRLVIPNSRMGSIIGKGGAKIREIQELSNARLLASEELLPHSTDRTVTLTGVPDAIHIAVFHISRLLIAVQDKPYTNVPYKPQNRLITSAPLLTRHHLGQSGPQQRQTMFIPGNIVGAVIGKGGSKINEIRKQSGCNIRIDETPGSSGERAVDIAGPAEACANAVYLLHQRIEYESRRVQNMNNNMGSNNHMKGGNYPK